MITKTIQADGHLQCQRGYLITLVILAMADETWPVNESLKVNESMSYNSSKANTNIRELSVHLTRSCLSCEQNRS